MLWRGFSATTTATMKLSELLTDQASLDPRTAALEIGGVTADSRAVKRGDLFVAVPGTKADVRGYYVGGKTGTSEKVVGGRYSRTKLLTTFTAILPADKPRYQVLIMLDEPQGLPETHGFATSGWNAAPTAGKVIARIAPMLGIEPRLDLPPADQLILAKAKQ